MISDRADLDNLLVRLERDVAGSVGAPHVELVRDVAAQVLELDLEDKYRGEKIVGDVQQALHDTFVDTTWPTCPRHLRHPLWYRDGGWWCEQDGVVISALGDLFVRPASG